MRPAFTAFVLLCAAVILGCSEDNPQITATPSPEPSPSVEPTTFVRATGVPIPSATPDPAASCVGAPLELGNPGPQQREDVPGAVVFTSFQVTDEDRRRVLDGLAAAREFIAREFGPVEQTICLEIRADNQRPGAAVTVQNRVIIWTQPGGWTRPYPWLLSRATAHEYVHVWSAEVAQDFAASNSIAYGPGWLVEGAADFLSMKVVLDAGLAPPDETEIFTHTLLRLSTARLEDLVGLPLPHAEDYATAELAVSRLMNSLPLTALEQYYAALGNGASWPLAFVQAFGKTPSAFYAEFAATPTP